MSENNDRVRVTKEISLGSLIQAGVIIATGVAFWVGLSGKLDVLQVKLENQGQQIIELKTEFKEMQNIVRPFSPIRP